eukprot:1617135-Pleurochrysis_carterae.AAC.1
MLRTRSGWGWFTGRHAPPAHTKSTLISCSALQSLRRSSGAFVTRAWPSPLRLLLAGALRHGQHEGHHRIGRAARERGFRAERQRQRAVQTAA